MKYILLIMIFFIACDNPVKDNFVDIEKASLDEFTIEKSWNFNNTFTDTEKYSFSYNINLDKRIKGSNVYFDGQQVFSTGSKSGSFDYTFNENLTEIQKKIILKIEYYVHSGNGSIADHYGQDIDTVYNLDTIQVNKYFPDFKTPTLSADDGQIKIEFETINSEYIDHYLFNKRYESLPLVGYIYRLKINNSEINNIIDSSYVGEKCEYEIKAVLKNGVVKTYPRIEKETEFPQIQFEVLSSTSIRLFWKQNKYLKNLLEYRIFEYEKKYNEISVSKNDTSIIIRDLPLLQNFEFGLAFIPSLEGNKYRYQNDYNVTSVEAYNSKKLEGLKIDELLYKVERDRILYFENDVLKLYDISEQEVVTENSSFDFKLHINKSTGSKYGYFIDLPANRLYYFSLNDISVINYIDFEKDLGLAKNSVRTESFTISDNGLIAYAFSRVIEGSNREYKLYFYDIFNQNLVGTLENNDGFHQVKFTPDSKHVYILDKEYPGASIYSLNGKTINIDDRREVPNGDYLFFPNNDNLVFSVNSCGFTYPCNYEIYDFNNFNSIASLDRNTDWKVWEYDSDIYHEKIIIHNVNDQNDEYFNANIFDLKDLTQKGSVKITKGVFGNFFYFDNKLIRRNGLYTDLIF